MNLAHSFLRILLVRWAAGVALSVGVILPLSGSADPAPKDRSAASWVGSYDGGQTEMAVGLELRADGRFRYALSYGALDEQAAGIWSVDGGQVLLTSDPIVSPRFVLVGQRDLPGGQFKVVLDVPDGMSRQYFHAEFRFADGTATERQLNEEQEPLRLEEGRRPTTVALSLPIFDVRGAPVPLSAASGHEVHFRFEPHDLGKVAFARTPLLIDNGDLILVKYDRTIRFRRRVQ